MICDLYRAAPRLAVLGERVISTDELTGVQARHGEDQAVHDPLLGLGRQLPTGRQGQHLDPPPPVGPLAAVVVGHRGPAQASAAVATRAGLRSLANSLELKVPYQGVGICTRSDRLAKSPDLIMRLVKGMAEAVVFIHSPRNKREVMEVLKKHLRLATDQDAETSYNALRTVSSLDLTPDPAAWKNIQKYVARVTPKVGQLDIHQIINGNFVKTLEETGFIAEAKKRYGL